MQQVMQLDQMNQKLIKTTPLDTVLHNLDVAQEHLSAACGTIAKWAISKKGQPFPPDVVPGKSYCDVQDKLGELYVGFSDLAYSHTPEALVQPVAELAALCAQHAKQLKKESDSGVPQEPCRLTLIVLTPLEKQLTALGWTRSTTH